MRLFMVDSLGRDWIIVNNGATKMTVHRRRAAGAAGSCISHVWRRGGSTFRPPQDRLIRSATVQPCRGTVAATMRLPKSIDSLKNTVNTSEWRRAAMRRVLGFTLVLCGLSMLLTGVESVFFH